MDNFQKELDTAKFIAHQAGQIMLKYFDGDQQVTYKEDNSPVTIADTQINEKVIVELAKHFANDGVIGEEQSTSEYGMGRKWICDPIDGTMAFTWGTPTSMFSLALVVDGVAQVGVAYDPFMRKLYWAVRGQGAYCNEDRIHVSDTPLDKGIFAVGSGVLKSDIELAFIHQLSERGSKFAGFSGAVFKACSVAKGKFTGYLETGVNAHDVAAIDVIVTEAGGRITGLNGEILNYSHPIKGAIITNGVIHDEIVDLWKG